MVTRNKNSSIEESPQNPESKMIYPHDEQAEAALLGSILAAGSYSLQLIDEIGDSLKPEYFYNPVHKQIYSSMLDLWQKQEPLDTIHVYNAICKLYPDLVEKQNLNQDFLLSMVGKSSLLASPVDTVKLLKDKFLLRTVVHVGQELKRQGLKQDAEATDILDLAQKMLYEASLGSVEKNFVHIGSLLTNSFEKMELLSEGGQTGEIIPTGFIDIDSLLGGGFRKSDMVIIACRPSMGKTSFSLDLAKRIASKKIGVAYFSLEMSADQLVERMIASTSEVDFHKIRTGNLSDDEKNEGFGRISRAIGILADAPIWIDDASGSSVLEIRSKARRLKQRHDIGCIIIDYLQLMSGGNAKAYAGNRVQEVADISKNLKILAKDLKVPVIALSQLSRKVDGRDDKRPILSDLRDSGSIEQDADNVIFIHREDYYQKEKSKHTNKAEIIIAKNRNGATGGVELAWIPHLACFNDLYGAKTLNKKL